MRHDSAIRDVTSSVVRPPRTISINQSMTRRREGGRRAAQPASATTDALASRHSASLAPPCPARDGRTDGPQSPGAAAAADPIKSARARHLLCIGIGVKSSVGARRTESTTILGGLARASDARARHTGGSIAAAHDRQTHAHSPSASRPLRLL